jgi:hypothetical protein
MPSSEHARYQLTQASRFLAGAKDAIYQKRAITLGDEGALAGIGYGLNNDDGHEGYRANQLARPDMRITNFREARNNDILNTIDTISKKTAFHLPKIQISGVKEDEQIVNQAWLDDRLKRCNAALHGKKALADYLITGLGALYITKRRGFQAVRWADPLDMLWDTSAQFPQDAEWMSMVVCKRMSYWQAIYPNNKALIGYASNVTKGNVENRNFEDEDRLIELTFYFNLDGDYKIFITPSDDTYEETPVHEGPNQHKDDDGEFALPFEMMTFMNMPSSRDPMGMTEKMLPAQMAIWAAVDQNLSTARRGKAFYEVDAEAMTDDQWNNWLASYNAGVVRVKNVGGIKAHPPLPMDPASIQEIERNQAQIRNQSSTVQADRGQKEGGRPITAAEIHSIQEAGQLAAANISADNADMWARTCAKMLSDGKRDAKPFTCMVRGHRIDFRDKDAVKEIGQLEDLLRPDAEIRVAEDSMVFRSKEQRMAEASAGIGVATEAMKLAAVNPTLAALEYRKYLEARGDDDIEEKVKALVTGAQPQQPQGAAPGGPGTAAAGVGG